jgi:hypothetical protein
LANLGYRVCDQTVGNADTPRSAARARAQAHDNLAGFHSVHLALLAGTDFLTAEVLTLRGLVTYYVLFFIHLESPRVDIAGIKFSCRECEKITQPPARRSMSHRVALPDRTCWRRHAQIDAFAPVAFARHGDATGQDVEAEPTENQKWNPASRWRP